MINKNEECCICLNKLNNNIKILECGHKIHEECFKKMIKLDCISKNNCPICREKIEIKNEEYLKNEKDIENENNIPLPIVQLFMFMNPFLER
jgi:hypothetical protein